MESYWTPISKVYGSRLARSSAGFWKSSLPAHLPQHSIIGSKQSHCVGTSSQMDLSPVRWGVARKVKGP